MQQVSLKAQLHPLQHFFQGFQTAYKQLVDQQLRVARVCPATFLLKNTLCEKHDARMKWVKNCQFWRANIAKQILQMPKQLRTRRHSLPPLLLLPLFRYRPLRNPSLEFPTSKDCWNHSSKTGWKHKQNITIRT